MKRTFLAIVAMLMMTLSVSAQRLTDIMADNNAYVHNIYARYPKAPKGQMRPGRPNGPRPHCDTRNAFKNDKRNKARFDRGRREFDNNSPEAIRMRQEMRRGTMRGVR